jgi:hypothetical protein
MSAAKQLLECLGELGATVRPAGDQILLRAGPKPIPADLVKRLRELKTELVRELEVAETSADIDDQPAWWRRHYLLRTINWEISAVRPESEARGIAWGELEDRWHRLHGARTPEWQCAGCGEPLAGFPTLDLADGNCVHFHTLVCLLAFGKRWRAEAAAGLKALGLDPPEGCAP